jgi:hypothetical protein
VPREQVSQPISQPHLSVGAGVQWSNPGRGAGHGSGTHRGHGVGGRGGGGGGGAPCTALQQPHMLTATHAVRPAALPLGQGVPGAAGMQGIVHAAGLPHCWASTSMPVASTSSMAAAERTVMLPASILSPSRCASGRVCQQAERPDAGLPAARLPASEPLHPPRLGPYLLHRRRSEFSLEKTLPPRNPPPTNFQVDELPLRAA